MLENVSRLQVYEYSYDKGLDCSGGYGGNLEGHQDGRVWENEVKQEEGEENEELEEEEEEREERGRGRGREGVMSLGRRHLGPMAQELQAIMPDAVKEVVSLFTIDHGSLLQHKFTMSWGG